MEELLYYQPYWSWNTFKKHLVVRRYEINKFFINTAKYIVMTSSSTRESNSNHEPGIEFKDHIQWIQRYKLELRESELPAAQLSKKSKFFSSRFYICTQKSMLEIMDLDSPYSKYASEVVHIKYLVLMWNKKSEIWNNVADDNVRLLRVYTIVPNVNGYCHVIPNYLLVIKLISFQFSLLSIIFLRNSWKWHILANYKICLRA